MACPPGQVRQEVPPQKHQRLVQICDAWTSGNLSENGEQIMTMADDALEILKEVGWVTERLLPNRFVGALVFCVKAKQTLHNAGDLEVAVGRTGIRARQGCQPEDRSVSTVHSAVVYRTACSQAGEEFQTPPDCICKGVLYPVN